MSKRFDFEKMGTDIAHHSVQIKLHNFQHNNILERLATLEESSLRYGAHIEGLGRDVTAFRR